MDFLFNIENWITLVSLSALEIILGIDNIIFISLLAQSLPKSQQAKARTIGIVLALVMRIILLLGIAWVIGLKQPIFTLFDKVFSARDLIFLGGGLFLLFQATTHIHDSLSNEKEQEYQHYPGGVAKTIFFIVMVDFVFSLDSIITAVGITQNIPIIITAMVISMIVMLLAAKMVGEFVERYPTLKMLALCFILMIGTFLVAEGLHYHVPRGYLYFAFFFSIGVEALNMLSSRKKKLKANKEAAS